jgi:LacI family transcriptional regulator
VIAAADAILTVTVPPAVRVRNLTMPTDPAPAPAATLAASRRQAPRVALLVETSKAFGRGVLQGVGRWLREHEPWSLYADERGLEEGVPQDVATWDVDGVISRLQNHQLPPAWRNGRIPLVSLRWEEGERPSPGIHSDEAAIAQAAADHLIDQGFQQLGFCGVRTRWSALREQAFVAHAATRGIMVHVFDPPPARRIGMCPDELPAIARWLEPLPRPIGIMAAYDVRALELLEAVQSLGLACPDDVAVCGVDDDEVLCNLATPQLTSVAQNLECIGYEAARILTARMAGRPVATETVFVPPVGVVVRRSSDMLALEDADLRRALRLIRSKACAGLSADEVARVTSLSRRSLERQFAKAFGRSVHDEIARTKLAAARRLLAETDLKLAAIAARCHFAHAAQLCTVFKKTFGLTPTEHRRRYRPWTGVGDGTAEPAPAHAASTPGLSPK